MPPEPYIPAPPPTKHERFLEAAIKLNEIIEGTRAERWIDSDERRLKDTPEWCRFYNALADMRDRSMR